MRDLTVRLDAVDPEAGAALRVIAYFDDLAAHGAGLQAIVRGAAVLTAGPAALVDHGRQVRIRIDAGGRAGPPSDNPDPAWPSVPVGSGAAVLWLEQAGLPRAVDAMVLERAAAAAAAVLDRTRGRAATPAQDLTQDGASVEVLLDPAAPPEARATACRLRLPESGGLRAVAVYGGDARIAAEPIESGAGRAAVPGLGQRAGLGPAVAVDELPASFAAARLALRLTAEGTPRDPGPRVVCADEAGGLMVLAAAVGPDTPQVADVLAVDLASQSAPWMLATLDGVASAPSLRTAAATLSLHHSSLQERIVHAERLLGWHIGDPAGRLRLQLALVLRRLHRAPRW